jgi:hypothetical protein
MQGEDQLTALAVRSEVANTQAAAARAQEAANSLYTRSPWDYADLGLNIFTDVARTNLRGAGGPASSVGQVGYSAVKLVPYQVAAGESASKQLTCEPNAPGVNVVPLVTTPIIYRSPQLTTTQPLEVPDVVVPSTSSGLGCGCSRGLAGVYPVGGPLGVSCTPAPGLPAASRPAASSWGWLGLFAVGFVGLLLVRGSAR